MGFYKKLFINIIIGLFLSILTSFIAIIFIKNYESRILIFFLFVTMGMVIAVFQSIRELFEYF